MKNLVPWLKSNWLILVLALIATAALPTLWYFSTGMRTKALADFQKKVEGDYRDVTGAKMSYSLVSPTGEKILDTSAPANHFRIQAYKEIGDQLQTQTGVVSKAAMELNTNAGQHKPAIEGIFPAPSELEKLSKPKDLARAIKQVERPRLLKSINAGSPPSAAEVGAELTKLVQEKRDEVKNTQGRTELDSAETAQLTKDLLATRLTRYQAKSQAIQVYADETIFDEIPAEYMDNPATLATCWDWQERLWIDEDVLRAVAATNGDSGRRGVPGSVIKRISKMTIEAAPFSPTGGAANQGALDTKPYEAGTDRAPTDFTRSITGRTSGPGTNNKWYDVRTVTMDVIADAKRLPAFIDALASTNFMTVIDADLDKVDSTAQLREGYFYGEDPIVHATLVIETVWFREWREPWMPLEVKRAMGMDKDAPAATGGAAPPPPPRRAAPPPKPPAGRPAGGDDGGGGGVGRRRGGGGD